ncbi:hypothetical protein SAMD00019534_085790 [Acytostelium subglobosum LB1]|uniref:hypothetical protein n=1 Tax=Acytostelium subglobosum LB1 TaxID=1410327 RepID=UPI000644F682|nr:hypothetical protein SAMD00019534_085790 [Acytostelium subglobosum LB1]GAM25404.1 hypothetical protein SAMD00019534_085790 [Acytostelium subglobosum LB1]|eukprot:XP_012751924.1 hypothetical protein SAMD00019534_085790 [Acytostelium subglobosum LB1]
MISNKRNLEYDDDNNVQSICKKPKADEQPTSKVIHLRNLPSDCTENDIIALASPFGHIEHALLIKGKNQGFIQMADLAASSAFVQYYGSIQGNIRSKDFFVQFSNREELKSCSSSIATPNKIMLITITNVMYPVTIEVLHQLFSKYGEVSKILIFAKSGNFQTLIQMQTEEAAIAAKKELDGHSLYNGSCTLKLQFSSLTNLSIKYNNDKSRDYTNPALLPGSASSMMSNPIATINLSPLSAPQSPSSTAAVPSAQPQLLAPLFAQQVVPQRNCVLIVGGLPLTNVTPDDLHTLFGVYGDPIRVKIMYNKKDTALVQMNLPQQAEIAIQYLNNVPFRGSILRVNSSKHQTISLPKSGEAHTLHLSNLPPDEANIEALIRELFSKHGTIKAFNLFPNDNKMALIEMDSLEESVNSLVMLHHHAFGDYMLKVSFAKSSLSRAFKPMM